MYMLISFIVPIIMLVVSVVLIKYPPKNINSMAGYRTTSSKRSLEAWKEGNAYSSRLLLKVSIAIMLFTLAAALLLPLNIEASLLIVFIDTLLILIGVIFIVLKTEKHLKNLFGK